MKTLPVYLLTLGLLLTSVGCQEEEDDSLPRYSCPPLFIRLGNSCYYFSHEMTSWYFAHYACQDHNSTLAALETQWEDETLRDYMLKPQFAPLNRWIGGIYNWESRLWTWGYSASVMPYSGFLTPGFPRSSRWHAVYLSPIIGYRWDHKIMTEELHYICEVPLVRLPDPNDIVVEVNTNL